MKELLVAIARTLDVAREHAPPGADDRRDRLNAAFTRLLAQARTAATPPHDPPRADLSTSVAAVGSLQER